MTKRKDGPHASPPKFNAQAARDLACAYGYPTGILAIVGLAPPLAFPAVDEDAEDDDARSTA